MTVRYEGTAAETNAELVAMIEPTEGWKYGFKITATTYSGKSITFVTDKEDHADFLATGEQVKRIQDLVEQMMKGHAEDGVITLGQTKVRGSRIETFTVSPMYYEPVHSP